METSKRYSYVHFILITLFSYAASSLPAKSAVLIVGPNRIYKTPCQAIAAAAPGDIIEIDAATYTGDVCAWSTNNLTLRGVGGRPKLDAAGKNAAGKGIWVIYGADTVIENIEFTGAAVKDLNGAGIRHQGRNLTVRNCYFHHNQTGMLASGDPVSQIVVEYSEFAYNGVPGASLSNLPHNIYINGHIASFTMRFSYSHHARSGHLVKSRAAKNYLLYNRLTGESGVSSYELELPNGGTSYVIGNVIQQGLTSPNTSLLGYLLEGTHASNPGRDLYVINNTFVNARTDPSSRFIQTGAAAAPVVVRNNIFKGVGMVINQSTAILEGNFLGAPAFVNEAAYDYRLLPSSPAIDAGKHPGHGADGYSLTPEYHYIHKTCSEGRTTNSLIDAGAYEFSGSISGSGCFVNQTAQRVSLALDSTSVTGSQSVGATLTLSGPAPAGGAWVSLTSSNIAVASVPAGITIPAGALSARFSVSISSVSVSSPVVISASYSGTSITASLVANPSVPTANVSLVYLYPQKVFGSHSPLARMVYLDKAAGPGGVVVSLSSSQPSIATVPSSVTIPAGARFASFSLTTKPVNGNVSAVISATLAGKSVSATLSILANVVKLIGLSPSSVRGPQVTTKNIVTLDRVAPPGGTQIMLRSSKPSLASVPAAVTVPAGALSVLFPITTQAAAVSTSITITAANGSSSKTAALTILP